MIPKAVKEAVWRRDHCSCVGCGRWVPMSCACAHFVARSHGGLGIEKNVLTLCLECHQRFDNGTHRAEQREKYGEYLMSIYGDLSGLTYRKGE